MQRFMGDQYAWALVLRSAGTSDEEVFAYLFCDSVPAGH